MPITLASGHADKGCLQSPELAPSECCPQPPPNPLHGPRVHQAPSSRAAAWAGCQWTQSQWRACHLPGAMRLVPKHGLGVSRVPSTGTRYRSPGRLRSSRLGTTSHTIRTTLAHGDQGAPVMPGQWVASLWGRGDGRGEGGWLGHRCCHRSGRPTGFQPPRTLFIRLSMLSGGGQESAPVLGPHGRQCPAPLAVPAAGGSWGAEELHLTASSG